MARLYIDADGCPVKEAAYRVAERHRVAVTVVSNSRIRVPPSAESVVVAGQFDAADDWIVEHVADGDVVVSEDILLASRCIPKGARVLNSRGRLFTEDSIGEAVASRELLSHLRQLGVQTGGPAPLGPRDRSRFMQVLDELLRTSHDDD